MIACCVTSASRRATSPAIFIGAVRSRPLHARRHARLGRCAAASSRLVGFDPTNNLVAHRRHIRTAVGRDYADVPPTTASSAAAQTASSTSPCMSKPAPSHPLWTASFPSRKTGPCSSNAPRSRLNQPRLLLTCSRCNSSNDFVRLKIPEPIHGLRRLSKDFVERSTDIGQDGNHRNRTRTVHPIVKRISAVVSSTE